MLQNRACCHSLSPPYFEPPRRSAREANPRSAGAANAASNYNSVTDLRESPGNCHAPGSVAAVAQRHHRARKALPPARRGGKPVETAADLLGRVARTVAEPDLAYGASEGAVEALAEAFCELMARRLFMPNSPTLMNAGRPLGQLSACFVLPVDDALSNGHSGIYDTLTSMALVHQSGGGTGFSFSKLRPGTTSSARPWGWPRDRCRSCRCSMPPPTW